MKNKILKVLGIFVFSSLAVNFAYATEKDFEGALVSNKDLIETTEKNDNGVVEKTEKIKNIENGKIYTLNLSNCNEFSKYGLNIIYSSILKAVEKDFNSKKNANIEGIFKDVEVNSSFRDEKYVSFKVMLDEDLKNQLQKYFEEKLKINDVEKFKENLKEIVKEKLTEKDYDEIFKKYSENFEKKIELEEKRENFFSDSFSFFNGFFDRFDFGFGNDDIFDRSYFSRKKNQMLNEVKEEISRFSKFDANKINKAIDCIRNISKSGDFRSKSLEVKKYVTNGNY